MSNNLKQHEEANNFALELLLPEKLFREKVDGGMIRVGDLANFFQVTCLIVRHRAKQLGYKNHGL